MGRGRTPQRLRLAEGKVRPATLAPGSGRRRRRGDGVRWRGTRGGGGGDAGIGIARRRNVSGEGGAGEEDEEEGAAIPVSPVADPREGHTRCCVLAGMTFRRTWRSICLP